MKEFWDEKHPELSSFTSKNLRDHVSSIIKRKVVMETDFDLENENIEQTNTDNSDRTINDHTFVNNITGSDNSSIIIEQITPEGSNLKESIREQFKCLLERKDEILFVTNFTSLVLISTMIALLAILFVI